MQPEDRNENRVALWPAREKRTAKSPDYTGTAQIGGLKYKAAAWDKTSDNPKAPALTIKLTPADDEAPF